jgi:hypothetical protein
MNLSELATESLAELYRALEQLSDHTPSDDLHSAFIFRHGLNIYELGNDALPKHVEVSGQRLLVIDEIQATFAIPRSKNEVYAEAVRDVLRDACQAIGNSDHQLRVPLEAGIRPLRLAIEATQRSELRQV